MLSIGTAAPAPLALPTPSASVDTDGTGGQFSIARSLSFALNSLMNPLFLRATTFVGPPALGNSWRAAAAAAASPEPDADADAPPARSNSAIAARALAPLALADLTRDLIALAAFAVVVVLDEDVDCVSKSWFWFWFCPCMDACPGRPEGEPVTPFALLERSRACAWASSSEMSLIEGEVGFSFHPGNPFTDRPCTLTSFR